MATWTQGGQLGSGPLLMASRFGRQDFASAYAFMEFVPQMCAWSLLFLGAFKGLDRLLCCLSPGKFPKMAERHRGMCVLYILELAMTTFGLVVQLVYGWRLAVTGTFHDRSRLDGFDDDPSWVGALKSSFVVEGLCAVPMLSLYVFEMVVQSRHVNPLLMLHHVVVIASFAIALRSIHMCTETAVDIWLQGWIVLFHITLEQPFFVALLLRRFEHPFAGRFIAFVAWVYTPLLRLTVNGALIYAYIRACHTRFVYTGWHVLWRWLLPVFLFLIVAAQTWVWRIYVKMDKAYALATAQAARGYDAEAACEQGARCAGAGEGGAPGVRGGGGHAVAAVSAGRRCGCGSAPLGRLALWLMTFAAVGVLASIDAWSTDCAAAEVRPQRVAVIGGGGSGLAAAWQLAKRPGIAVTVFERNPELGGAAHTAWEASDDTGDAVAFDLAFRTFKDYHNFEALLGELGVEKDYVGLGLANVFKDDGGRDVALSFGLGAGAPDRARSFMATLAGDIAQYRAALWRAAATRSVAYMQSTSVGELLAEGNYSSAFLEQYIPSCMTVYVGTVAHADTALSVAYFFEKHFSACTTLARVPGYVVRGGVGAYIKKLGQRLRSAGVTLATGVAVERLSLARGEIVVHARGSSGAEDAHSFDRVIVATNDHASYDKLLTDHFSAKPLLADIASRVSYHRAMSALTRNVSLVPESLRDARTGCWNLEAYTNAARKVNGTWQIFGNNFHGIDTTQCYRKIPTPFQYFGASDEAIEKDSLLTTRWNSLDHDSAHLLASRNLHKVQGADGVYFAGANAVVNLHEWATSSGLVIANQLGGGYPFEGNSMAREGFLATEQHMLFGVGFMSPKLNMARD